MGARGGGSGAEEGGDDERAAEEVVGVMGSVFGTGRPRPLVVPVRGRSSLGSHANVPCVCVWERAS